MNKGKPSGTKADTKRDAGIKSTIHERGGQAGTGPEARSKRRHSEEVHPGGDGGPDQQAGGPDHHGGDAHEDRNP